MPHKQHPRLKKHFFISKNPMFLPAAVINTKGGMSDMPIVQATDQPRTPPPGSRESEQMPRDPSCRCLPECSVSQAMATGAVEASCLKFESSRIRVAAWAMSHFTDQLMTPYFSGGSTINATPGGDRWVRVLSGQIGLGMFSRNILL